jgi:hypothetical protein
MEHIFKGTFPHNERHCPFLDRFIQEKPNVTPFTEPVNYIGGKMDLILNSITEIGRLSTKEFERQHEFEDETKEAVGNVFNIILTMSDALSFTSRLLIKHIQDTEKRFKELERELDDACKSDDEEDVLPPLTPSPKIEEAN